MDIEKILEEIHKTSTREGRVLNKTEFNRKDVGSAAYREMSYEGIEDLVKGFKEYFNKDTVFYDLGSGVGKMVYHIGLKYKPKKACGIEYSKERHQFAVETKEKLDITCDNINFLNENFLESDISDATVIYTDNLVFPKNISEKLYEKAPKRTLIFSRKDFIDNRIYNNSEKVFFIETSTPYKNRRVYYIIK